VLDWFQLRPKRPLRKNIQPEAIEPRRLKALLHDLAELGERGTRLQGVRRPANFYVVGHHEPLIEEAADHTLQFEKLVIAKLVESAQDAKPCRHQKRYRHRARRVQKEEAQQAKAGADSIQN
jgi:hypothetical protein